MDHESPSQGELLGDVKAGFPSLAEDIREKLCHRFNDTMIQYGNAST